MIRIIRHWLAERLYWLAGKVEPRSPTVFAVGWKSADAPESDSAERPNHMIYDPLHLAGDPVAPTSPWQGG